MPNIFQKFRKITEDWRSLLKTFEENSMFFWWLTNKFKSNLRDKFDISEIIDNFPSEDMENTPLESWMWFLMNFTGGVSSVYRYIISGIITQRALILSNSYWVIMNKIFMYARPCSIKWCVLWRVRFQKSCKISVEFSATSFCLSFSNVKIIANNPNPPLSLWLLPGKDVYFNVSILTLFVDIFIEYIYFVFLCFH